jgi:hypothetical protein
LAQELPDCGLEKGAGQVGPADNPPRRGWTGVVLALPDVVHDLCGGAQAGQHAERLGFGDQPAILQGHRRAGQG